MTTKRTLSVPVKFKLTARKLGRLRGKSISALVVELREREAAKKMDPFAKLSEIWKDNPVTTEELRKRAWKRH